VIHTVGPVWASSIDHSDQLASAYRESMRVAAELGATRIPFPAISAGVYGWPIDDAARIAVSTVSRVIDDQAAGSIGLVRFVLFTAAAFEAFEAALAR
jgi:O-acetyl-ADP-ribose deacetylase (regulator of RNase III)